MRYFLAICFLALVVTGWGQSSADKLSPMLRKMAVSAVDGQQRRVSQNGQQRICVFVRAEDGGELALVNEGCRILDKCGSLLIAEIPLHRLMAVAALPHISRLEAGPSCTALMDTAVAVVGAQPVYEGTGLPQAYTGRGVMVGLMDIGFDLTHPNFFSTHADGGLSTENYRIRALWDQLSTDTLGATMPVGRTYEGAEALLALGCSYDGRELRHGTHTLGSAAGCGAATPWHGLAFESDICLVANATSDNAHLIDSLQLSRFTTATDALGFKYLFDQAARRGMPCVASFSEGYIPGFDDEDQLYREYLDSLTGPGRILVAAAGNESRTKTYLEKSSGTDIAGADILPGGSFGCYYVHGSGPFEVALYTYHQAKDTLWLPLYDIPVDSTATFCLPLQPSQHMLQVDVTHAHSAFSLLPNRDVWQLIVSCDTVYRAVPPIAMLLSGREASAFVRGSSSSQFYNRSSAPRRDAISAYNVMAPGCFESVITVGATASRLNVVNYKGDTITNTTDTLGRLAYFSSVGPTVDGLVKPDVVAPGSYVISSYNSYHLENMPASSSSMDYNVAFTEMNGRTYPWGYALGTSMSTPVVAGAIALWLQAKPDLTPEEVKHVLSRTCIHPDEALDYPNSRYGHGQINVYAGLLDVLQLTSIQGLSHHPSKHAKVSLQGQRLMVAFDEAPCRPYAVQLWSLDCKSVLRKDGSPAEIDLSGLPAGVYAVQLQSSEEGVEGSLLIRKE